MRWGDDTLTHGKGNLAIEGFTCTIIFKNIFSFALTFKAYDWLVAGGIRPIFIALGTVQVVVCLLSIPMCKSLIASQNPRYGC
jgi:hypothetical protein